MNIVVTAKHFATAMHYKQTRRDGAPYITHPAAVADAVDTDEQKAVAWLHDVLEDTPATENVLRGIGMPEEVVLAVVAMTKTPGENYADYLERVFANDLALVVKLADIQANTADHETLTPELARKYDFAMKYLEQLSTEQLRELP